MKQSYFNNFEKEFSKEVLLNERFRLYIIAAIFLILVFYLLTLLFFFKDIFDQYFGGQNPLYWVILILGFFAFRSLIVRKIWNRWLMKDKKLPEILRYFNSLLEVSIPTIIIIVMGLESRSMVILLSPLIFLYFIFILLSTLELDFKLCFFTGSVAAIEYILLGLYYTGQFEVPTEMSIIGKPIFYIGKGAILFITGILAGMIARQISNRIISSYKSLDERNNIEKLFGQQVSTEIVDELINSKYEITGKRRFVCIMFLDIRGYTPFSEGKQPEEIIKFQNDIFGFMIEIINKNHGIINQFMGDGFMATFGAPVSTENDCQNAVDSAIEICNELNEQIKQGNIPDIKIGIGLHAGEVVTGNVGTSTRKQYSVTGNTVILASRIEQLNKKYDSMVLISKEVLNKVQIDNYKSLGEVDVKGRQKPIEIFEII
ncbi:adenylate/guanylate cyclase domain-containing protein [Calditrichota bacterium]